MAERPSRNWRGVGATTVSSSPSASLPLRHDHTRHDDPPIDQPDVLAVETNPWENQQQRVVTPVRSPRSPFPAAADPAAPRRHVDYRLDPAPVWGGDLPEKNFKEYHRNLLLWLVEAEARIPSNLIGKRIIDSIPLGSKLSALVAHLTVEEICAENGHKVILGIIEEAHEYLKELRLERAFDEAIFRGRRERGQSLTSFLTSKKAAFAELKKQGLDLLATPPGRHLLGHLILRQGSFTQDQRQRLKVVTNGSIDYKLIEVAVQKVFGDKLDEQQVDGNGTPRRWRNASYWEDGHGCDEWDDDEMQSYAAMEGDYDGDDDDIFQDLICLNENAEVQMAFPDELPMVMEESEALETIGGNLENIFYETRDRLATKGKGKGKKGKGKGGSKTFGQASYPGFGGGRGGGYLEHRRLLQATRNGRGYDKPWQQRRGTKLSISELKARSRCHTCKQVGHWSRECHHRKPSSSAPGKPSTPASSLPTGFFVQPPQHVAGFGADQQFFQTFESEKYMPRFAGLSFVFLGTQKPHGTALVDTAAQHGLVGIETLEAHDKLLRESFGLQVQWSNENGGTVRGVCGSEETTKIAHVPIGLGGKSGVLRVQVVPGDIPFLLPAYFLTDLEAVIDMKHAVIMYMALGVKQVMHRLNTGHVAVSIVEFGDGFQVPANFAGKRSQAWSVTTLPNWSTVPLPGATQISAMGPVAALGAAAAHLAFPSSVADSYGSGSNSTIAKCPAAPATPREIGTRSSQAFAGGTTSFGGGCIDELYGNTWISQHLQTGGAPTTFGGNSGERQVPGAKVGAVASLPAQGDQSWGKSSLQLPEVPGLRSRTEDAADTTPRSSPLEFELGLHAGGLPQAHDQQSRAEEQGQGRFGGHTQSCTQTADGREVSCNGKSRGSCEDGGEGGRVGECGEHWRGGRCDDGAYSQCPHAELRCMPCGRSDIAPTQHDGSTDLEMRQHAMSAASSGPVKVPGASERCLPLSSLQCHGNDADLSNQQSRGDRTAVHECQLQSGNLHVRDAPGVLKDGKV